MNLDPIGSPRHEQTVAVALRTIIAQDSVQRPRHKNRKAQSMVTMEVVESMGAPGGVEPPTNGLGNRCSIQLSYGAASGLTRLSHASLAKEALCGFAIWDRALREPLAAKPHERFSETEK